MSIRDALYRMCHDYPGGLKVLAARMKLAESSLQGMANPNDPTHGWSLERFREAMHFANDTGPLESLCQEFGGVFVKIPHLAEMPVGLMFEDLAKLAKEFGDVPREVMENLSDGRLTAKEFERIKREVMEMQQAGAALLQRLEAMVERPPIKAVK